MAQKNKINYGWLLNLLYILVSQSHLV